MPDHPPLERNAHLYKDFKERASSSYKSKRKPDHHTLERIAPHYKDSKERATYLIKSKRTRRSSLWPAEPIKPPRPTISCGGEVCSMIFYACSGQGRCLSALSHRYPAVVCQRTRASTSLRLEFYINRQIGVNSNYWRDEYRCDPPWSSICRAPLISCGGEVSGRCFVVRELWRWCHAPCRKTARGTPLGHAAQVSSAGLDTLWSPQATQDDISPEILERMVNTKVI